MVRYRVDRSFLKKKDADLINYLNIIGTNVSTKPEFAAYANKGTTLLTLTGHFQTYYEATLEGDRRQIELRDKYKLEAIKLVRDIADDVNELADGDASVISAAGFTPVTDPSKDRLMGTTFLISVEYIPQTGMVKIRCRRADRAVDYQVDVSTDGVNWEEGVDSIPLTVFYIKWKKPKGKYFIRLCPRDHMGMRGTPSNVLELTVY